MYPSHDSLATLAAVAAATSRIGLMTNILLAPLYPPVTLAKAAATIDQISGSRFTLGLAPGIRQDDFAVTGRDFHSRGADFEAGLDLMHRAWRGEPVGVHRRNWPARSRSGSATPGGRLGGTANRASRPWPISPSAARSRTTRALYLRDYYAYTGEFAEQIAGGALRSEPAIREAMQAYADFGFTDLYFDPTVVSLDQVDRLADLVL